MRNTSFDGIIQPPIVLSSLYEHPLSCLAVFRTLSPLARHYVVRLLYSKEPVARDDIVLWCRDANLHRTAMSALEDLKIFTITQSRNGKPVVIVDEGFAGSLKVALTGSGTPNPGDGGLSDIAPEKKKVTISKLDAYATERWEAHLAFLVGSRKDGVCQNGKRVLLTAGLMKGSEYNPSITAKGFQFLLQPVTTQVWLFMLQFYDLVENIKDMKMNLVDVLKFQFQLSFSTLGQAYLISSLTHEQQDLLQILRKFGLAYRRSSSDPRFYPTRLSIAMSHGLNDTTGVEKQGFLIVETNMRIFAYTHSQLEIALLSQFVDLRYRFPDFIVGIITRESVRRALVNGITGEQIIGYIKSHAHPQMRTQIPVIPVNVSDQIMMWEKERDRLEFHFGYLYDHFVHMDDAAYIYSIAEECGAILWSNPAKTKFMVSEDGYNRVRKVYQKRKNKS
eukprot:CFRG0829T1